jgi:putative NADPH-quinone reductase
MKVLIILGHPDKKSFNHAIAQTCRTELESCGHTVFFHDLYAEKFNPVLQFDGSESLTNDEQIKTHRKNLINSDGIIIIHPNWWGQPPAIVKGWIDRVLLQGVAYDFVQNDAGEFSLKGLLNTKIALVFNTSNAMEDAENKLKNEPLALIWIDQVFNLCGIKRVERRNFGVMKESRNEQRLQWLTEVREMVNSFFSAYKS